MQNLIPSRKLYLLEQNRLTKVAGPTASVPATQSAPRAFSFISLSAGTSAGLAQLLPSFTGSTSSTLNQNGAHSQGKAEGWSNRFSIASLGKWSNSLPSTASIAGEEHEVTTSRPESVYSERSEASLEKQTTGGLWGWWTGSTKPEEGSAEAFIQVMRDS